MMKARRSRRFFNFEIHEAISPRSSCSTLHRPHGVGEGKRMEWDGPNMKSTNLPEAAQLAETP